MNQNSPMQVNADSASLTLKSQQNSEAGSSSSIDTINLIIKMIIILSLSDWKARL